MCTRVVVFALVATIAVPQPGIAGSATNRQSGPPASTARPLNSQVQKSQRQKEKEREPKQGFKIQTMHYSTVMTVDPLLPHTQVNNVKSKHCPACK